MGVAYTTREAVKAAPDSKYTARDNAQVDAAIESGSRAAEARLHRRFYPWTGTRYFDWPNLQYARPWRLWLDDDEMASITSLVVAGVTIAASDYLLRRSDGKAEAPYTHIEIDLSSSAAFSPGDTHQQAIAITGVYCGCPLDEAPAGTVVAGGVGTTSVTSVDVTNSAAIGVGSILRIDTERLLVTEKTMLDTTQNTAGALTAVNSDVTVPVGSGAAFTVGEVILIDAERMLIVDIAANNLIVKRAWDGSVLATHANPSDVYAARTLTVTRGALGTTAAVHAGAATVVRHVIPGPVAKLALAEAVVDLQQQQGAYARTVGTGDNERESSGRGLAQARDEAYTSHGRKARIRAV